MIKKFIDVYKEEMGFTFPTEIALDVTEI